MENTPANINDNGTSTDDHDIPINPNPPRHTHGDDFSSTLRDLIFTTNPSSVTTFTMAYSRVTSFTIMTNSNVSSFTMTPSKLKPTITNIKPINIDKNTECPISYEEIKYGDKYFICTNCKYNFIEQAILTHLTRNKLCPMCRSTWSDYCVYINKETKTPNIQENKT